MTAPELTVGGRRWRRDPEWTPDDGNGARLGDLDAALDALHAAITLNAGIETELDRYHRLTRILAPHLTPTIVHNLIPTQPGDPNQ